MPPQDPTLQDLIRREARAIDLPEAIALGVAEQESSFNPFAQNPVTLPGETGPAYGTFQLIPSTAARFRGDYKNPDDNIRIGVQYLKELFDRHHGDEAAILREYGGVKRNTTYIPQVSARIARWQQAIQTGPPPPPPSTPWYQQAGEIAADLGIGALKGAGQTATNLGRLVHQIPGVSSTIDTLYGTPGLSAQAFGVADQVLAPTTTAQKVGKVGEQIGEALIPGARIARLGQAATRVASPTLVPILGQTLGRLAPRAAVEAAGAAGIAKVQGNDPKFAAGVAASIPAAGALLRIPFGSRLPDVQQRAVDWARAHGIPIDLGTSTANQFIKRLQTSVESTPFGAPIRAAVEFTRGRRLPALADEIGAQISPTRLSPAGAAASVSSALDRRVAGFHQVANAAYDEARRIAALAQHTQLVPTGRVTATGAPIMTRMELPVDLRLLKGSLRAMYRTLTHGMGVTQRQASGGLQALDDLINGPNYKPLIELERDLGAIKQLADPKGALRNVSQGVAARVVRSMQTLIDHTARRADPALLTHIQAGRAATATKYLTQQVRRVFQGSPRRGIPPEPMSGFNRVFARDDIHQEYVRRLAQEVGPTEMRRLSRAFLTDLMEQATAEGGYKRAAAVANQWEAIGPVTKRLLFSPGHIDALDNLFRIGRMLAEHPNPSGSAVTAIAAGSVPWVFRHPESGVPTILGAGAVAALMNHPTGVRLLTQGLTIPGGTPAAAAWMAQLQAFIKEHRGDVQEAEAEQGPPAPPARATASPPPPPTFGGFEGAELR